MNIGENIKKYRKEKKITQKKISELLDINIRTYQKYESGDINPSIDTISQISFILDIPIFILAGESEAMDLFAISSGPNDKSRFMSKLLELSQQPNTIEGYETRLKEEINSNIETLEELVCGFNELEANFNRFKNDYIARIEELIKANKKGEQDGK